MDTVTPDELAEAARILNERCDQMGYGSASFTVSENKLIGKVPANVEMEAFVARITAVSLLEFTDFGTTPVPEGSLVRTDFENPFLPQANGESHHTIMTNAEIKSATVTKSSLGQYQISFSLTEQGTKIFSEFTSNNIGHYLAIVLDKKVLSMPAIQSAITAGSGVIVGNFTEDSAQNLAAYLQITPLPIPLVVSK